MDQHNNAVGRELGAASPDGDCAELCRAALDAGRLRILGIEGGRVPPDSPLLPSGPGGEGALPNDSNYGGGSVYDMVPRSTCGVAVESVRLLRKAEEGALMEAHRVSRSRRSKQVVAVLAVLVVSCAIIYRVSTSSGGVPPEVELSNWITEQSAQLGTGEQATLVLGVSHASTVVYATPYVRAAELTSACPDLRPRDAATMARKALSWRHPMLVLVRDGSIVRIGETQIQVALVGSCASWPVEDRIVTITVTKAELNGRPTLMFGDQHVIGKYGGAQLGSTDAP
jgi:hypothetical protein